MSLGQVAVRPRFASLTIVLCLVLAGTLLPGAVLAADGGDKTAEYIVTLSVADSGRAIKPSSKSKRARIARRADRVETNTKRLAKEHDFKARHRYSNAITGFSAKLTAAQVRKLKRDGNVVSVRPVRKLRLASQDIPDGVRRVHALPPSTPAADYDVDVAVLDTGIGPSDPDGTPLAMGPSGKPELNIAGGVNCTGAVIDTVKWGDPEGHGTHVAGIIAARDNDRGVVGVAPGARLWAVRSFDAWGNGSDASVLCGLDWLTTQPQIDVVNMSIEGPRYDYHEDCDDVLADPSADPMHTGVCNLTNMGVTVVAAAGNYASNANDTRPGGYDQVISVGALADFDGKGESQDDSAPCSVGNPETDDTYASFSNWGTDVDIVAPGVCILSTSNTTSGADLQRGTGTSQAAPHVTGAVARYLAANPGTTPSRMRNLVRAAGRLDWKAKSDPLWSGVNDSDEPNRVLDVRGLMGLKKAKVWLLHDGFDVGGTKKTVTTRIDIQRRGGYNGTAKLSVSGLPADVGTAALGSSSLTGLKALGTKLTLNLKTGGPDGNYGVKVKSSGSGADPSSAALALKVDRTGPVIAGLKPKPKAGAITLATTGQSQTKLLWTTTDKMSKVTSVKLQRKIWSKPWATVSGVTVALKPTQHNKFRVKATDSLGNQTVSQVVKAVLWVRDSKSARWDVPKPDWKTKKVSAARGGSLLVANGSTPSLSTTFTGKAVAVVSSVGPGRGSMRIRVDGGNWNRISLKESKTTHRRVVWSRTLPQGKHTLEIQGVSGQSVVDAALILGQW